MGLYSHYSTPDLEALRQRLMDSLHARLTGLASASHSGRAGQHKRLISAASSGNVFP